MSRDFNGTTAYVGRSDNLGLTGYPFSFFCWFNGTSFGGSQRTLFSLYENANDFIDTVNVIITTGSKLKLVCRDAVNGYVEFETSATATAGVWSSAAAIWAASNSRALYLNGANKVTNTGATAIGLADINRMALGAFRQTPTIEFFAGQIAHAAMWNTALTDDDVAMLHAGLHPTRVKSTSLRAYWSLSGKDSPEVDIVGRNDLTVTNATVSNEEPRIFRNYA